MTTDDRDAALLASLEHKLQYVRDRVQGVAEGYQTGFYLWGEGGTSKSYTVEQTLQQLGTPYKLTNSRLTGKGLFKLLRDFPDAVHVIEDAGPPLQDRTSPTTPRWPRTPRRTALPNRWNSSLFADTAPAAMRRAVVRRRAAFRLSVSAFTAGMAVVLVGG